MVAARVRGRANAGAYPWIVAHRGASRMAPENSVEAVRKAIDLRADMVEIDVRRSLDGVLIAHHDPELEGSVVRATTYPQLRRMAPHLATLSEILQCLQEHVLLDVELKEEGYEWEVLRLLAVHIPLSRVMITSFSLGVVAAVAQMEPRVSTGWILEHGLDRPDLFQRLKSAGSNRLVVNEACLNSELIARAAREGVRVAVWTVNQPIDMHAYVHTPGIEAIITDLPNVALAIRSLSTGVLSEPVLERLPRANRRLA